MKKYSKEFFQCEHNIALTEITLNKYVINIPDTYLHKYNYTPKNVVHIGIYCCTSGNDKKEFYVRLGIR